MNTKAVGGKGKNLEFLQASGFNVPKFVVVPAHVLVERDLEIIAEEARGQLSCSVYCVRSSAWAEDGAETSMAGQFHTETDVEPGKLAWAIGEVLKDAESKLGSLASFDLVIQEYIRADRAGVAFTREPSGSRQMVIESVRGVGEGLVGGGLKPQRIELYRGADWRISAIDQQIAGTALKIEALFGSPQDIEWVVRRGVLYIVQSRPITTITKEQIALAEYLDELLPTTPFYFAKTGVAEIVPRPSVWALETLKTIYAKGGPVDRVYQKHGINYIATEQFVLVDGQLYIDKEAELQSLLPAFSYFGSGTLTPKVTGFAGLITTWRNLRKIQGMKHNVERLEAEMKAALSRKGDLIADYELVFEIGLAAEGALKKLEGVRGGIEMTDLLSARVRVEDLQVDAPVGAIGNSLDVADTEPFVALQSSEAARDIALPSSLVSSVQELQRLVRLREYARWLVVKRVHEIRASVSSAKLARSKPRFSVSSPTVLTNHGKTADRKTIGVSAGVVEGVLATEENISETSGSVILVVKQLSPSLVQYFGRVAGVVSENGGLLSHFAILAREQGLPVVVGVDLTGQNGEQVRIDGTTGEIHIL